MAIKKYPLSSANGRAIPLDVLEPRGADVISFTTTAPGTSNQVVGWEEFLYMVRVDQYALLQFSEDGSTLLANSGIILFPNTTMFIAPRAEYFHIYGNKGNGGELLINYITRYDSLATGLQLDQG